MGTLERTETLSHHIGTNGRVSVKTIRGLLRVRGIDGEEARLTVTYRIRAADHAAAERALETGRVMVDRGPGSLEVETPERRLATGLAWLFGGARVNADVSLEVPWGTKIRYETMSGAIEAVALVGDQKYRTVAGDIRLWSLGGLVEASSISGSITLDSGGDIRLRANTISGAVRVRARRFYGMAVSTTSGRITVVGALDPAGDYRAESISGGVTLTPLSGLTAELRTVSGSISSEIEHRIEGGRGFWRSVIGDGRPTFRVNSTSGGLRILAARPGDQVTAATAPAEPTDPARSTSAGADTGAGAAQASADAVPDSGLRGTGETWSTEEPAEVTETAEPANDDDELAILQALERGEIGVDEAARRLERARR